MAPYRKQEDPNMDGLRVLTLIGVLVLALITALSVVCAQPSHAQDDRVVVTIRDFGQGMTPVIGAYNTSPETILYSENMMSLQPGMRQLRAGYSDLITYSTIADTTTSPIDGLGIFAPTTDSSSLLIAAGGKWFWSSYGTGNTQQTQYDTFRVLRQIRPYPAGDSVTADGDSLVGYNTRFVRDVQAGDTITVDAGKRLVQYVASDAKLYMGSAWDSTVTVSSYIISRSYQDSSYIRPFFLQSGDMVYTGTPANPPQIIYENNDTLRMRGLEIVDSFLIDSIYSIFGNDSSRVRSWATTATNDTFITQMMVVARTKAGDWATRDWSGAYSGDVQTYYFRFGEFLSDTTLIDTTYIDTGNGSYFVIRDTTCAACTTLSIDTTRYKQPAPFYQILGNDDTSLTLSAWYIDRHLGDDSGGTVMASWRDSIFNRRAPLLQDTIHAGQVNGRWGYIYSSAGSVRKIVADGSTGSLRLTGGGGVMATAGTSLLDPDTVYRGFHFIHLTGNDVQLYPYADSVTTFNRIYTNTFTLRVDNNGNVDESVLNEELANRAARGDTVLSVNRRNITIGGKLVQVIITERFVLASDIGTYTQPHDIQVLSDFYFPIRYIYEANDSTFFVVGLPLGMGYALSTTQQPTTSNWEIVRVGMPYFAGMEEWNTPAQLVGWGDTLSGSMLSFSGVDDPWAWSGINDVLVGNNPSDPVIAAKGYDNLLALFKKHSTLSYDGFSFKEISQSDGIVGRDALVGVNDRLFWLDMDGVKTMSRRAALVGSYEVQKVSGALDPVFNALSGTTYGGSVVPFKINPAYRHKSVLTYNQRDNHLYLFFPQGSDSTNSKCLTYDVGRNGWDGYHNLRASAAIWATLRDTSRIVMGSPDSALIVALDYAYNDNGVPINGVLRGGAIQIRDAQGWPQKAFPTLMRTLSRSNSNVDSVRVNVIGYNTQVFNAAIDTASASLTFNANPRDMVETFRFASMTPALYWQCEYRIYGDSTGSIFQPIELDIEFRAVERDD